LANNLKLLAQFARVFF